MSDSFLLFLVPLTAYLLGSISFAVVVSRIFKMADPRSYGSGNPGANNVLRSGNKLAAALTLLGDSAKGAIAVCLSLKLPQAEDPAIASWLIPAVALAVFIGHLYPVFFRFQGGKGVATAAGIMVAVDWQIAVLALSIWLFMMLITRYSSVASIVASLFSAPLWYYWHQNWGDAPDNMSYALLGITLLLILRHKENIRRLYSHSEYAVSAKPPV